MNKRRQGCCCCVVDGLLYGVPPLSRVDGASDAGASAIGGADEHRLPTASCEVYNPATDEWREIAEMGLARQVSVQHTYAVQGLMVPLAQDAACAVVDGLIVVMGGSDGVQALDGCEVL